MKMRSAMSNAETANALTPRQLCLLLVRDHQTNNQRKDQDRVVPPGRRLLILAHGSKMRIAIRARELLNISRALPEFESAVCLHFGERGLQVRRQHPGEQVTDIFPVPADNVHDAGCNRHVQAKQGKGVGHGEPGRAVGFEEIGVDNVVGAKDHRLVV